MTYDQEPTSQLGSRTSFGNQTKRLVLLVSLLFTINHIIVNIALAEKPKLSDEKITTAVEKALSVDPSVPDQLIDIDTKRGVITLDGKVPQLQGKNRATRVAETVRGVQSVINMISVKDSGLSDDQIRRNIEQILTRDPATKKYGLEVQVKNKRAVVSGTVYSWAARNLADNIAVSFDDDRTEGQIADEIRQRLDMDVWINADPLEVSVRNGHVSLSGVVGSAAEKRRAVNDAYVTGVKKVDDSQLFVKWWAKGKMKRQEVYDVLSDDAIQENVQRALAYDPRVFWFSIDATVKEGIVTLKGKVDNLKAKHSAEETARQTRGVLWVNNHLKVRLPEYPDDTDIQRRIETVIKVEPDLERFALDISVQNGKVILDGTVGSYYERRLAEEIAADVKGVLEIQNNLVIPNDWEWAPDAVIQQNIEEELWWSPFVDRDSITVTVENGVATLRGMVNSWFEYEAAIDNAKEGGARLVESQLTVSKYLGFSWPPPKPNP